MRSACQIVDIATRCCVSGGQEHVYFIFYVIMVLSPRLMDAIS